MVKEDFLACVAERSKPRSVLIVLSTGHVALRELRPVIEHFHASGWRVVLRLGASGREVVAAAAMLREKGMDVEVIPPGIGYGEPGHAVESEVDEVAGGELPTIDAPQPGRAREAVKRALRPFLVHRAVAFWRYYRAALRRRAWATALLREKAVDAVLMNMFHSVGEIDNAVQWATRRAGLPLFCLTNAPYVGEATNLVSRTNHLQTGMVGPEIRAHFDPMNQLLAALFPSWTRVLPSGVRAFFWDPVRIIAGRLAGLGMNRMWIKPSVDFDRVFVFGEFSRDLLLECGYPAERIQIAGQPLLDDILLHREDSSRQNEIAVHIGVPRGERFLLVNIEPSFEHSYAREEDHWQNFHAVMRACSAQGVHVVLSLHPLCEVGNYQFAEAQYGCRISTKYPIHELYPACAASVSFPCSTNVLALRFSTPLVIYDFHRTLGRDAVTDRLYRLNSASIAWDEFKLREHVEDALANSIPRKSDLNFARACVAIFETVRAAVDMRNIEPKAVG